MRKIPAGPGYQIIEGWVELFYNPNYHVYQDIRLNQGKRSNSIMFESLIIHFELSCVFQAAGLFQKKIEV